MKLVTFLVVMAVAGAAGYWLAGELGIRDELAAVGRWAWHALQWIVEKVPQWVSALADGWREWTAAR